MNKILFSLSTLLLTAVSIFATGLNFQSLGPTAGDILLSNSNSMPFASTTVRVGTLTGNVNLAGSTFSTYTDYDNAFSSITTALLFDNAPTDVSATIPTDTLSSGVNLWMLVDTGSEQGVIYLGATPSLGQIISSPDIVSNATGGSGVSIGSISGSNILLQAVPEPSAFALLAGCFGLAAVMVRRRR